MKRVARHVLTALESHRAEIRRLEAALTDLEDSPAITAESYSEALTAWEDEVLRLMETRIEILQALRNTPD